MATTIPQMPNTRLARSKLLLNHPFFGSILLSLPVKVDRSLWYMATDGRHLLVNPEACETLNVPALQTLLCHEVLHVAFQHVPTMLRMHLNRDVWNIATDHAINLTLQACGMVPFHRDWVCDPQYTGLSALQIYDRLIQNPPPSPRGGQGTGEDGEGPAGSGWDLKMPDHAGDPSEVSRDAQFAQSVVAQAATMSRAVGRLPGALERLITEMLEPVVPWRTVLQDYMTRVVQDEETWRRRNRRFGAVYLPSRHSEQMGEVVFIGDTSGSIQSAELVRMASEVSAIAEQLRPEKVRLVWADTDVAGEQLFECGEPVRCEPKGGGGTDMRAPLAYVEAYDPQVVILATDGYTPWPEEAPPYPLIVLCTTAHMVPDYAQVIRL